MDRKAFIKSCRRKGYKYVETAKFLGVSRQRVEQLLRPKHAKARAKVQENGFGIKFCEYPNCSKKAEAHHPDYDRPLDVIWLCPQHHKALHASLKKPKVKKIWKCLNCQKELTGNQRKWCIVCAKKHFNKLHRITYQTNPIQRAKHKVAVKNWIKNNKDKVKAINKRAKKKYDTIHREKLNAYKRDFYQRNKVKFQLYYRERYKNKKLLVDKVNESI